MWNRMLIFIALFCTTTFVMAQTEVARFEMLIRKPTGITSAADAQGRFAYFLYSSTQYHVVFFDAQKKSIGSILFTKPKEVKSAKPLSMIVDGDQAYIYLYNEKTGTIGELQVTRASGQHSYATVAQLPYQQKFLKALTDGTQFYLLAVPSGRNELAVWSVSKGKASSQLYGIELPDFYKRLSTGNSYLNEEPNGLIGIDRIRTDIENNVKSAQAVKKVYVSQGKITLTFDDPDYTHLLTIDTKENKASYKKLKFSLENETTSDKKQGNSFLWGKYLFRFTVNTHQFNVSVIDLDSMVQRLSFNGFPGTELTFKNGPMLQEGNSDKDKIIPTTEQFIKKVLAASVAIAVNQKDSLYVLEIGGFETYTTSSGPYGTGGSNFSMSMGMGMGMGYGGFYGGYPGYYGGYPGFYGGYPGYYPYSTTYTTQVRSYYFYSLLHQPDFSHKEGIVPISLRERISNFQEGMFKEQIPELVRLVNLQEEVLVGYYVGKTGTFRIYQFVK